MSNKKIDFINLRIVIVREDYPAFKKFLSHDISYQMAVKNRDQIFDMIFENSRGSDHEWILTRRNCERYHSKRSARDAYQRMLQLLIGKHEIMNGLDLAIQAKIMDWALYCGKDDFKSWALENKVAVEVNRAISNQMEVKEVIELITILMENKQSALLENLIFSCPNQEAIFQNKKEILKYAIKHNSSNLIDLLLSIPQVGDLAISEGRSILNSSWSAKLTSMAKIFTPIIIDKLASVKFKMNVETKNVLFDSVKHHIIDMTDSLEHIWNGETSMRLMLSVTENILEKWDQYQKTIAAIEGVMVHRVRKESQELLSDDLKRLIEEFTDTRAILPYKFQKIAQLDETRKWRFEMEISEHTNEEFIKDGKKETYEFRTDPNTTEYQSTTKSIIFSAFHYQKEKALRENPQVEPRNSRASLRKRLKNHCIIS